MKKNILKIENIKIELDTVLSQLHISQDDEFCETVQNMLLEATKIAKPKAVYLVFDDFIKQDIVKINNIEIIHPFVHKMISSSSKIAIYVASCGTEIDKWAKQFSDPLEAYTADLIKQSCLNLVYELLFETLKKEYFGQNKNISTLQPGSLVEWPIDGQKSVFDILGGLTDEIGVFLTKSCLMLPNKSLSGILFESVESFENCQLCSKANCENRRAECLGHIMWWFRKFEGSVWTNYLDLK